MYLLISTYISVYIISIITLIITGAVVYGLLGLLFRDSIIYESFKIFTSKIFNNKEK